MAAAELARGHNITITPIPDEIIWFLLAKEFHWTPKMCKEQDAKDIRAITHILSTYNRVKNNEAERGSKSHYSGSKNKVGSGGKFMRVERVGPGGIQTEEVPL
jgi:hypothetical protein